MRIAIFGEFGDATLGAAYADAFRALGHEVSEVDYLADIRRWEQPVAADWLGARPGAIARRLILQRVLARLRPADLVLVLKGFFIDAHGWDAVRARTGGVLVNFYPDDPFNLNGNSSAAHVTDAFHSFDIYLVWSTALVRRISQAGARRADFLPFASDPANFYPVRLSESERQRYDCDLCFVGNWDRERERWLEPLAELNLSVWGGGWDKVASSRLRGRWRGRGIVGDELLRVIAAGRIQLNILRLQNKSGHNMRTYELPACQAFMLTERSPDLPLLFKENAEVAAFSTHEELIASIRHYLVAEPERRAIAQAGYTRALQETYIVRAKQMLDMIAAIPRAAHIADP